MKNETRNIKIPQIKIREILGLDEESFYDLRKVFSIVNADPISYQVLHGMIDYQSKIGKKNLINFKDAKIEKLKIYEQKEKIEEKVTVRVPKKKILKYKDVEDNETTKTTKTTKRKYTKKAKKAKKEKPPARNYFSENFIKFSSQKEAAKAYNQDQLKLYYSLKPILNIENGTIFNIKKGFAYNMKEIKKKHPGVRVFHFYSDNKTYDKSIREMKIKKSREFTKDEDEMILNYYNSEYYRNPNANIKNPITLTMLQNKLNIKCKKTISLRASKLGFTDFITNRKNSSWCKDEIEILKENIGLCSTSKIQKILKEKGYQKSLVSINVKLTRMKISLKLNGKGDLSLRLLSEAFGVDTHFFTNDEKRMEFLKPEKSEKAWYFSRENIKNYVVNNPYDINLAKVDNKFFIELLIEKEK